MIYLRDIHLNNSQTFTCPHGHCKGSMRQMTINRLNCPVIIAVHIYFTNSITQYLIMHRTICIRCTSLYSKVSSRHRWNIYIKKKRRGFFFCRTMWYVLIFQGTQHIFWWPAVNFVTVEHFKAFVRSSNHIPAFVYAPGMREVTTWCTNTPCVMG